MLTERQPDSYWLKSYIAVCHRGELHTRTGMKEKLLSSNIWNVEKGILRYCLKFLEKSTIQKKVLHITTIYVFSVLPYFLPPLQFLPPTLHTQAPRRLNHLAHWPRQNSGMHWCTARDNYHNLLCSRHWLLTQVAWTSRVTRRSVA